MTKLKNVFSVAALAVVLGLMVTSCKCEKNVKVEDSAAEGEVAAVASLGTLDSLGNFIWDRGEDTEITLADGTKMMVGKNSTEYRLYDRLNGDYTVSEEPTSDDWFVMDRVYFATGGNDLTAESEAQVNNIATILKNFPNAAIKLGGYTDNTGGEEVNIKVSGARAQAVSAKLGALGIAADKLSAEGFGPKFPICEANDTDECKAQNRRVDIRVASK